MYKISSSFYVKRLLCDASCHENTLRTKKQTKVCARLGGGGGGLGGGGCQEALQQGMQIEDGSFSTHVKQPGFCHSHQLL